MECKALKHENKKSKIIFLIKLTTCPSTKNQLFFLETCLI